MPKKTKVKRGGGYFHCIPMRYIIWPGEGPGGMPPFTQGVGGMF